MRLEDLQAPARDLNKAGVGENGWLGVGRPFLARNDRREIVGVKHPSVVACLVFQMREGVEHTSLA